MTEKAKFVPFRPSEKREFKAKLRPLLESGLTHLQIAEALNKEGFRLPGDREVTRSCVALYAVKVMRRRRTASRFLKRGQRGARVRKPTTGAPAPKPATVPASGTLGLISEFLTRPGLTDAKRLELIQVLIGGK